MTSSSESTLGIRLNFTPCTQTPMSTSQDKSWKPREQAAEAAYVHEKEQAQLAALRAESDASKDTSKASADSSSEASAAADARGRDFEGGFGGQEDLEDRYATTSGEH
ncbi:hypothetical protein C8R44DRAFT_789053 [Mycena epipterygia]|nr:hypothetical protein C8R44DRAFT_789053 [Mycena epipterygia]